MAFRAQEQQPTGQMERGRGRLCGVRCHQGDPCEHDPRRESARSPTRPFSPREPASRSAAGPASSPTRAPLATGRAGIFAGGDVGLRTQDDHRRGRCRTACRRLDPRVPCRRPRRRGRDHGRGAVQDGARAHAQRWTSQTRPRAHAPLPWSKLGTFAATQAGFAEDVAGRRHPDASARRRLWLPQRPRS